MTEQETYCERLEKVLEKLRSGHYDIDDNLLIDLKAIEEDLKEDTYV